MEQETQENDLVFEVRMADQDHAKIVQQSSELLQKMTITGTIFFMAICLILSFNLFYLFSNISKSENILRQGNSLIGEAKQEQDDLRAIIGNQNANRGKINYLYEHISGNHK